MKKKKQKPFVLPKLTLWEEERANEIQKKYRSCLLAVGKSMDCHVYDISENSLGFLKPGRERNYLLRCRKFFDLLSFNQRRCFIAEILEKGRVYPFWFTQYLSDSEYYAMRKEIFVRAVRYL